MTYGLGVAAAIVAGIVFNVGILIQKTAVKRVPPGRPLMKTLLRSPVWIGGFVLQFVLGTPLYTLSVGMIGPAVVPGLMSIGLVVLALGAVRVQKERLPPKEIAGIAAVILSVAGFGLSQLSINVHARSIRDPELLIRTVVFTVALAGVALFYATVARRTETKKPEGAAALHAVRSGIWYNLGNLGLGFITAGFVQFWNGRFDTVEIIVFFAAVGLVVVGNVFGIVATQHALRCGRAVLVVPLQNAVSQILPVAVYFLVYALPVPSGQSMLFLGAATALMTTGVILLTRRITKIQADGPKAG